MTAIPSFLPAKTRLSPKFHYNLDTCRHLQKISITNFELVDTYKRQVSTPSPVDIYKRQVSILVDIYKRRVSPNFEAWWRLIRLCHCDLWTSRQPSLNPEPCWHLQKTGLDTRWHLQKTSITKFWSLVASHPVMSLRPLNQQTAKSQPRALLTFTKDRSRYLLTFTKDKYHQFRACWHLQKTSLNPDTRWHLQKTSITNFWSLVASQPVMSLRPLNWQIAKLHLPLSLVASQPVMSLRPLNQQTAKSQFRVPLTLTKDRTHRCLLTFTKGKYLPFSPAKG